MNFGVPYMGSIDHNNRTEFNSRQYCPHIEKDDEYWIRKARSML